MDKNKKQAGRQKEKKTDQNNITKENKEKKRRQKEK